MRTRIEDLKKLYVFKITETSESVNEGLNNGNQNYIKEQMESLKSEILKLGKSQLQARTFAKSEYQALKDAISDIHGNNDGIIEAIIKDLLAIADGLEAGIQSGNLISNQEDNSWINGMKIVRQRVMELLEKLGVHPIQSLGTEFNPFFHKAIDIGNNPEVNDNIILAEQRRGYVRNNKVIRYAEVIVNRQLNEFAEQKGEINE